MLQSMHRGTCTHLRLLAWILILTLILPAWAADSPPRVRGVGMKECAEFRWAWQTRNGQEADAAAEYQRYRSWLEGFVTGLDLATDMDVLVGVRVDQALSRIAAWCQAHPREDFLAGTRDLIKVLSQLDGK